jgi:hypothetical protein
MTDIRAHIRTDFALMGIAVTVTQRIAEGHALVLEHDGAWLEIDPAAIYDGASYRFTDDVAKALLEALLDHYRGGHDARQLRADYEAERKRVDKMLDTLMVINAQVR